MNCDKADELIELLLSGEAKAAQIEKLNEHAASCARCARSLGEAEQMADLLTGAMGSLSAAINDPSRFAKNWIATSRAMQSRTPEKRPGSSRRASPIAAPRLGAMAAMVMGGILVLLLTWLLLPKVEDSTRRKYAISTLNTLNLAITNYQADFGVYPPTGDASIVAYLDGDPSNGGPSRVYFPFAGNVSEDGLFLDPWGRPFHYRVGTKTRNVDGFDLWSEGPKKSPKDQVLANWMDEVLRPK